MTRRSTENQIQGRPKRSLIFNGPQIDVGFPGGDSGKERLAKAGDVRDMGSIHGLGRSPGEGHGNPIQYSCLENPMDRGIRWAMVHRVAKSQTRLKGLSMHANRWCIITAQVAQAQILALLLEVYSLSMYTLAKPLLDLPSTAMTWGPA